MKQNFHLPKGASEFRIPYDQALNPQQLEAVMFQEGPALVVAGAGSGKTRTLTYRVARLVEEGISPRAILLLTFTRKAAEEMLTRSIKLLDHRCGQVSGGTFHSFANTMLRRFSARVGYDRGYSILDRADAETLIGMLRKEVRPTATSRSFPTKRTLANIFSKSANKDIPAEEIIGDDYTHFKKDLEAIVTIHRLYSRHKREHMVFDYDDLLVNLKYLLEIHQDVREKVSTEFRYIMVDEYQDTNKIQAEILYLLAGAHRNIMAVGDDSQSIYSFRGANFENIMKFPEIFSEAGIIRLEENYRSTQPILDLTNTLLDRASRKFSKHLFTSKSGGTVPALVHAAGENNQSVFVIDKINELHQNGTPLNQIAVLFRAGFHSFDLEIELNREGIPFIKVGGFKFMESAHIKDVLAHLRIILNPLDRISWYRVLNLLERIGPKTAGTIFESIVAKREINAGLAAVALKPGPMRSLERLKELYAGVDYGSASVVEIGGAVIDYYETLLKKHYDDHPKRRKDLDQLMGIMDRYNDIGQFLTDMALEPPTASVDNTLSPNRNGDDRLVLSTVHSAKGLEWHTVIIIWALDGRFPSMHALEKEADLEEELRLMYVAATRARENLFFTCPGQVYDRISSRMLNRPSRFIDGISEDLLERIYPEFDDWMPDF